MFEVHGGLRLGQGRGAREKVRGVRPPSSMAGWRRVLRRRRRGRGAVLQLYSRRSTRTSCACSGPAVTGMKYKAYARRARSSARRSIQGVQGRHQPVKCRLRNRARGQHEVRLAEPPIVSQLHNHVMWYRDEGLSSQRFLASKFGSARGGNCGAGHRPTDLVVRHELNSIHPGGGAARAPTPPARRCRCPATARTDFISSAFIHR